MFTQSSSPSQTISAQGEGLSQSFNLKSARYPPSPGLDAGVRVAVLNTVAVNIRDCSPFGSMSPTNLPPARNAPPFYHWHNSQVTPSRARGAGPGSRMRSQEL